MAGGMSLEELWSHPTLELQGSGVGLEGAHHIAESLASTDVVRYLGLADNRLGNEGVKLIMAGMCANQSVEIIDLSGNNIQDEGAEAVASMLHANNTVRSVILSRNKIRKGGAERLAAALVSNNKVSKFDISENRLRGPGATAFGRLLEKNTQLKTLNLRKNEVNSGAGVELAKALLKNTNLQSLNLSNNLIGEAFAEWGRTLTNNSTLLELDFEGCLIYGEHVQDFSERLLRCSLMSLNLSHNNIGDGGMQPLLDALKEQAALRMLDLSDTGLTARSVDEVCSMLKFCTALETLELDQNNLGCEGVSILAAQLKHNQSLTSISVANVGMDQISAVSLALSLHSNLWCTSLNLAGNDLTDQTCTSMCYALKRMTLLNHLDFSANHITEDSAPELAAVFVNNPNLSSIPLMGNPIATEFVNGVLTRRVANRLLDELPDRSAYVVPPAPIQPRKKDVQLPRVRPTTPSIIQAQLINHMDSGLGMGPLGMMTLNSELAASGAGSRLGTGLMTMDQRAAALLSSADALAQEESERVNGTYPPLIPPPGSLESPYYPGFGHGRFSNGCSIARMNDPVPYTVANSLGEAAVIKTNGQLSYSDTLFRTRLRKVPKINPYSERALEANIGGLLVTEKKLRQAFQELDVDGNGYLDKEEFKALYTTFDNFGLDATEEDVDDILSKYKLQDDGKLCFEEFSLLLSKVAQR